MIAGLTRARDRLEGEPSARIDLTALLGTWVIFADDTSGLTRVEIAESNGSVRARTFGSASRGEADWGEAELSVFSDDVAGTDAWGFLAAYDHGYERVELNGYLNRGLLAVEAATTFSDSSGRSPYFTRTFMYRP
jgi:hypothetical protein